MKKILIAVLFSVPVIGFGTITTTSLFDPEKEGLPLPDGGIKVIPMKKIDMTKASPNKNLLIAQKQIKENGFFKVDDPEARVVLNMRNIKPLKPGSNNAEDTNLKSTIKDVGLAFDFKGIPVNPNNVIGYGAGGLYQNGWTAVTEIFTDRDLGTCQYSLFNIKLSHGSEFVPEETARYVVNGKITTLDVRGSVNSGYTYSIHWADKNAMQDLQCANMTFDKSNTDKLIALAKKTDKFVIVN